MVRIYNCQVFLSIDISIQLNGFVYIGSAKNTSLTTYIDRVTCLAEQDLIVDKAYKVLHIKSAAN